MRTEDLIRVLATDGSRPVTSIERTLSTALLAGVAVSALAFVFLHPRSDFARALLTFPFAFKLLVVILLAGTAAAFLAETARPVPASRRGWTVLLAPVLLLGGVIVELATFRADEWTTRLIGHNAIHCLTLIPLLSLPPLVSLLVALRRGAPGRPALAGATAGLVAGGAAATLYAITCPDDSPLFIATWYSIAIALVTGVSAYSGARMLRW
jgi:hypothetical protein